jgi:hypothetical protein
MRRKNVIMKNLKRMLLTAMMLCIVPIGALAQKGEKPPPPKPDPPKIVPAPKPTPNNDHDKKGGRGRP